MLLIISVPDLFVNIGHDVRFLTSWQHPMTSQSQIPAANVSHVVPPTQKNFLRLVGVGSWLCLIQVHYMS